MITSDETNLQNYQSYKNFFNHEANPTWTLSRFFIFSFCNRPFYIFLSSIFFFKLFVYWLVSFVTDPNVVSIKFERNTLSHSQTKTWKRINQNLSIKTISSQFLAFSEPIWCKPSLFSLRIKALWTFFLDQYFSFHRKRMNEISNQEEEDMCVCEKIFIPFNSVYNSDKKREKNFSFMIFYRFYGIKLETRNSFLNRQIYILLFFPKLFEYFLWILYKVFP